MDGKNETSSQLSSLQVSPHSLHLVISQLLLNPCSLLRVYFPACLENTATAHLIVWICQSSNKTLLLFSFLPFALVSLTEETQVTGARSDSGLEWDPGRLFRLTIWRALILTASWKEKQSFTDHTPVLDSQMEAANCVGECVYSSSSWMKCQHFIVGVGGDWAAALSLLKRASPFVVKQVEPPRKRAKPGCRHKEHAACWRCGTVNAGVCLTGRRAVEKTSTNTFCRDTKPVGCGSVRIKCKPRPHFHDVAA